jgi:hypothetical protein
MLSVIMLSANPHYTECLYSEHHYTECNYAECHYEECCGAMPSTCINNLSLRLNQIRQNKLACFSIF